MAVKDVSARWLKASKASRKKTRFMGRRLAELSKKKAPRLGLLPLDDPLEAAVFSVLVKLMEISVRRTRMSKAQLCLENLYQLSLRL